MSLQNKRHCVILGSPESTDEAKYNSIPLTSAYSIFPAEVWEDVLRKCSSGNLHAIRSALPELASYVDKIFGLANVLFESIFPILAPYLTTKDILKCRLTSTIWCSAIDNIYPTVFSFSCRNTWKQLAIMKIRLCLNYSGERSRAIERYNNLNNHPRNVLVGRTAFVTAEYPCYESTTVPFNSWTKMWKDIWHLRVHCPTILFNQVILLTPNIRSIYLELYQMVDSNLPVGLPDLNQLTTLGLHLEYAYLSNKLPLALVKRYGNQLKHLRLVDVRVGPENGGRWNPYFERLFEYSDFKQLEELSITGSIETWHVLAVLKEANLQNLNWFQFCLSNHRTSLLEFIRLTHKMPNLSHVEIRQLKRKQMFGWSLNEVNDVLPKLMASATITTLELHLVTVNVDLSFVRLFPNIRKLVLKLKYPCSGREHKEIDELGNNLLHFYSQQLAEEDLLKTTWEIIPSLYYIQLSEFCAKKEKARTTYTKGFKRIVQKH